MAAMDTKEGRRDIVLTALQGLGITLDFLPYQEKPERGDMQGIFCKNLFLKDRKGEFYLVICPEEKNVDLKQLKQQVGAHRNFSFGTPCDLDLYLGCESGAVTPYAVIWDTENKVRVIIDNALRGEDQLNFHPMDPKLTSIISWQQLLYFLEKFDHEPMFVDVK